MKETIISINRLDKDIIDVKNNLDKLKNERAGYEQKIKLRFFDMYNKYSKALHTLRAMLHEKKTLFLRPHFLY